MTMQIVKKVDMESSRGRKKRNPLNDLRREVAIMRTLRHKNIVALQVVLDSLALASFSLCLCMTSHGPAILIVTAERLAVSEARHCSKKLFTGTGAASTCSSQLPGVAAALCRNAPNCGETSWRP